MISEGDAAAREASAPTMPAEWSTTMCASHYSVDIIGLNIGSYHIEGYRRQGIRVAAICGVSPERLAECAQQSGVERT